MSGGPAFEDRRHPSRLQNVTDGLTPREVADLRFDLATHTGRFIEHGDFGVLLEAVALARLFNRLHKETHLISIPRRERITKLGSIRRLSDRDMVDELRVCDLWTFNVVRFAWLEALYDAGLADGSSFDPPDLDEHLRLVLEDSSHAIPGGAEMLRNAVVAAYRHLRGGSDVRGRPDKNFQADLARNCTTIWAKYGPPDAQAFWRSQGGSISLGLQFAKIVFEAASMQPSASRLEELFREVRKRAIFPG